MFGYVRPDKGELLVRELARFRSVYCGICKEIGRTYGQIPRIALTYDITVLGVFLVSLTDDELQEKMGRCILNPISKKPIMAHHAILDRCASISVILAYGKILDEIRDGKAFNGKVGKQLLRKAFSKASRKYPDESAFIMSGLTKLKAIEDETNIEKPYDKAASQFGEILQYIFRNAFLEYFPQEKKRDLLISGISQLGYYLGKWIFTIDAIDDYEQDIKNGNWNPFIKLSRAEAEEKAKEILTGCEVQIDQIAALLPYKRDAGIISNIFQDGLPTVRQKIFLHQKLRRL